MVEKQLIKSRFRESSEHTLDPKGRLNFPSRYKDILQQEGSNVLMVTTTDRKCLRVYTYSEWLSFEESLLTNKGNPVVARFIRFVSSRTTKCSLDKQGRILLPASLRAEVGIEKDVVLNGMLEFAEIWAKDAWVVEDQEAKEEFPNFDEALSSMGIL